MAKDSKKAKENKSTLDSWYGKLSDKVGGTISNFVAFIFIVFSLGSFYGILVTARWPNYSHYLLIAPLLTALLAYYNRAFATLIFAIIILFFIIL